MRRGFRGVIHLLTLSIIIVVLCASAPAGAAESPMGLVVIDPGHGGADRGAMGPGGVREKDLTLRVARRLASVLKKRYGFMVALTRDSDTFVSLEDRTRLANTMGASFFVSIHVNAARSPRASGIETFFLSYDATDEEAVRLAAVENGFNASKTGIEYTLDNDLKATLLDLVQTEAQHESSTLAEEIHTSLVRYTGRADRGVKQAPLAVLDGAEMPAVLVELGFISNPSDKRWLLSGRGMEEAARAIALGIADFQSRSALEVKRIGLGR